MTGALLPAPAMGTQNAWARQVGSVAVTLTYATGSVINVAPWPSKGTLGQPSAFARSLFLFALWASSLGGAALNLLPEFRNDLPRFRLLMLPRPPRLMR